jgi:hypothetical protein
VSADDAPHPALRAIARAVVTGTFLVAMLQPFIWLDRVLDARRSSAFEPSLFCAFMGIAVVPGLVASHLLGATRRSDRASIAATLTFVGAYACAILAFVNTLYAAATLTSGQTSEGLLSVRELSRALREPGFHFVCAILAAPFTLGAFLVEKGISETWQVRIALIVTSALVGIGLLGNMIAWAMLGLVVLGEPIGRFGGDALARTVRRRLEADV